MLLLLERVTRPGSSFGRPVLREAGLILGFIKQHVPGEEIFFCLSMHFELVNSREKDRLWIWAAFHLSYRAV